MITKELQEIFTAKMDTSPLNRHSINDMATHFETLANFANDCAVIHELGVRELGSSWAFLKGLADKGAGLVEMAEDRRSLIMSPAVALISIDHIHPDKFGGEGTLAEFQRIAEENYVHHQFIEASSLDIEIEYSHCIFFDTDHTYSQLSKELQLHGNKSLKYLIFHDTTGCAQEIVPAINEFLEEYEEWRVFSHTLESQGLTALGRMSAEQFDNMNEHQIKSREGEQHRPSYEDENND